MHYLCSTGLAEAEDSFKDWPMTLTQYQANITVWGYSSCCLRQAYLERGVPDGIQRGYQLPDLGCVITLQIDNGADAHAALCRAGYSQRF